MKYLKNILFFIVVLLFSACSDFLDKKPDDMLTLEMVFGDKTRTEDWLAGVYNAIPDPYWRDMSHHGVGPLGDDLAPSTGWQKFGWDVVAKQIGNWNPASYDGDNRWVDLPKRIRSALIFIDNVRPNAKQLVTEAEVENMKNEARFLIAYYYTLLLEKYGPVPFNPNQILPTDVSQEELLLGQTPYDTIVNWIDQELVNLSKVLPASYTDKKKYGRATSIMCLAVRARMLLFAASPLVNGNPDYKGHVNWKGEELFNSTYDPNKWKRAAQACKELIDAAHAAGHKLYYEYNGDGTIDPFLSYQNMMFKKGDVNPEILFARPGCDYTSLDRHATPRGCAGNGGYGITQSLVDAFFMENGLPPILGYQDGDKSKPIINSVSGYKEKGFSTEPEVRKTKWIECQGDQPGKEGQVTLAGTYNMYCHREPRFYISVLYNRAWYRQEGRTTRFLIGEWDGGPTHDAPQNGYLLRKMVHPDHNCRTNIFPYRPGILYRLGEAYLNYAEALNESDPGNPDIVKYLNLIRERAGIPTYGNGANQIPLPQGLDAMREAIHRERRVELNCEGSIRWNDIRRWKMGKETLDGDFYGMNYLGENLSDDDNDPKAFFVRKPYQKRVFEKQMFWFPVPQDEMDKNPNLTQNPLWK